MLGLQIMDVIRRRRAELRERFDGGGDGELSRLLLMEYDALIAELQVLERAHIVPHPKIQDDPSEQWILGDQGQLGG